MDKKTRPIYMLLTRDSPQTQRYLKKEEQTQMNSLTSQLPKLEKEEQMRPKVSRRRDIIKIREEINNNNTKPRLLWDAAKAV